MDVIEIIIERSVEESQNLSSSVDLSSFFVIHDSVGSGHHQVSELSGRKDIAAPLLIFVDGDIKSGGDHSALVDSTNEFHNHLLASVVIDYLEFSNVAMLLHHSEESHQSLG